MGGFLRFRTISGAFLGGCMKSFFLAFFGLSPSRLCPDLSGRFFLFASFIAPLVRGSV